MNRRDFLKMAGLGGVAATLGATVFRVSYWWDQAPGPDFRVLSDEEGAIAAAITDALFPGDLGDPPMPNGLEVGVVEGFDNYLANTEPMAADALRMILHTIDDVAVFSDFGLTRFHKRDRAERIGILEAWDGSGLMLRRSGFRALKYALANQYCGHPQVLAAAGIQYTCGGAA